MRLYAHILQQTMYLYYNRTDTVNLETPKKLKKRLMIERKRSCNTSKRSSNLFEKCVQARAYKGLPSRLCTLKGIFYPTNVDKIRRTITLTVRDKILIRSIHGKLYFIFPVTDMNRKGLKLSYAHRKDFPYL